MFIWKDWKAGLFSPAYKIGRLSLCRTSIDGAEISGTRIHQKVLSPPSVKSKFYSKEKNVLLPIEKLLTAMLEDVRRFLR